MTDIVLRGSATGSGAAGADASINVGGISGIADGDFLVVMSAVYVRAAGNGAATTNGSGSFTEPINVLTSDSTRRLRVAHKFRSGDTTVTIAGTGNASDAVSGIVFAFYNVDGATPLDGRTPTTATGTSSNPNPPSVTTNSDRAMVVVCAASPIRDTSIGNISGFASSIYATPTSQTNNAEIGATYLSSPKTPAGAVDAAAFASWTTTNNTWVAASLVLKQTVNVAPTAAALSVGAPTLGAPALIASAVLTAASLALSGGVSAIFTPSATPNGDNEDYNTSVRMVCQSIGAGASSIRVNYQPNSAGTATSISHMSVGKWTAEANKANTTATPIEVKFGGASGLSCAAGSGTHASDWTDVSSLGLQSGDGIVVILDGSGSNGYRTSSPNTNIITEIYAGTSWNTTSTGANTGGSWDCGIAGIDQSVAGITLGAPALQIGAVTVNLTPASLSAGAAVLSQPTLIVVCHLSASGMAGSDLLSDTIFAGTLGSGHYPTGWSGYGNDTSAGTLIDPTSVNSITTYAEQIRETSTGGSQGLQHAFTFNTDIPYEISAWLRIPTGVTASDCDILFEESSAPKLVQHVAFPMQPANWALTGNSFKFTLPNPVIAGNCLVLGITNSYGKTITVSDDNGNTWPAAAVSVDNGWGNHSSIYVLPDANAGVTTITVAFNSTTLAFHAAISEFSNVTTVNGTKSATDVNGATVATGAFTPTNNDAGGGNLIWSYFAQSQDSSDDPTGITAGSGFTLLHGDIMGRGTGHAVPTATQWMVQETAASINPSITATADTTNEYNALAVALKVEATGGGIPAGIHINKIIHNTEGLAKNSLTFQAPVTGDLLVLAFGVTTGQWAITGVTDTDGNTYDHYDGGGEPQIWWAPVTPNQALKVTVSSSDTELPYSMRFYDIQGASGLAGAKTGTDYAWTTNVPTHLSHFPDITPQSSDGLMIISCAAGRGPLTAVTAPTGAIFDPVTYTGEVDDDSLDNADGPAHLYLTSTAAQNWEFDITTDTYNNVVVTAIEFLAS